MTRGPMRGPVAEGGFLSRDEMKGKAVVEVADSK